MTFIPLTEDQWVFCQKLYKVIEKMAFLLACKKGKWDGWYNETI